MSETHRFIVEVEGCSREQAEQVIAERIGPDEDYGFDYTIDSRPMPLGDHMLKPVTTREQAREIAIDWQAWMSEGSLSMGELAEWQGFFEELAEKFNLTEEFRENAII